MNETTVPMNIQSLEDCQAALESLGVESQLVEGCVIVPVGVGNQNFPAVIELDSEKNELVITAQIATFGDLGEENLAAAGLTCLRENSNPAIRPYAFSLIDEDPTDGDEDPANFVVVLTDCVPVGDFSTGELEVAISNLKRALTNAAAVLKGASEVGE